jgi:hypothetical protein
MDKNRNDEDSSLVNQLKTLTSFELSYQFFFNDMVINVKNKHLSYSLTSNIRQLEDEKVFSF